MVKELLLGMSLLLSVPACVFSQSVLGNMNQKNVVPAFEGQSKFSTVSVNKENTNTRPYLAPQTHGIKNIGYCEMTDEYMGLGVEKPAKLEAAMFMPVSMLPGTEGYQIENINFLLASTNYLTDISVWVSKDLNGEPLYEQAVSEVSEGWNTINLDTPVDLASYTGGIFVGFSITLTKVVNVKEDGYPLGVVGSQGIEGALLLCVDDDKWYDYYQNNYGVIGIVCGISGEYADRDMALMSASASRSVKDQPIVVSAQIANKGIVDVNSFSLEYTIDGETKELDYNLTSPLKPEASAYLKLELGSRSEVGFYDLDLNITKIDGVADEMPSNNSKTISSILNVSTKVNRKTVMEEGTGTWCQFCPRGVVGMEKLYRNYPDNFIGIAVHSQDTFTPTGYDEILSLFSGLPQAVMDRRYLTDPYYDVETTFEECNSIPSEASIALSAELLNNNKELEITSEVTFYFNSDASNYRIAYIIVEDSLPGRQTNYYSGKTVEEEDLQFLTKLGPSYTTKFNDVALQAYTCMGVAGSLDGAIVDGEKKTHTYKITLPTRIQNIKNVSLIAMVIIDSETSIEIVNAEKLPLRQFVGIDNVNIEKLEAEVKVVNGQLLVSSPEEGKLNAEVYTSAGVLLNNVEFENNVTIDLPKGSVYVVRVTDGKNVNVKKVVL